MALQEIRDDHRIQQVGHGSASQGSGASLSSPSVASASLSVMRLERSCLERERRLAELRPQIGEAPTLLQSVIKRGTVAVVEVLHLLMSQKHAGNSPRHLAAIEKRY